MVKVAGEGTESQAGRNDTRVTGMAMSVHNYRSAANKRAIYNGLHLQTVKKPPNAQQQRGQKGFSQPRFPRRHGERR